MKLIDQITIKYGIIGVINTLIGTSVMFLSYNLLGLSYWLSSGLNYLIGGACSYLLNRRFTFENKEPVKKTLPPFVLTVAICYFFAYGIAKPLTLRLLEGFSKTIQENIAMMVGMVLYVGFNYLGQRFIVFKNPKGEEDGTFNRSSK